MLVAWAEGLGSNAQTARLVVASVIEGNIRDMLRESPEQAVVSVRLQLESLARKYSGASNTEAEVFDELTEMVIDQFGHFGVSELAEAFRLAAAGRLGEIDARSYYGLFTGFSLGTILTAYDEFRKSEILRQLQAEEARLARERSERHTLEEQEILRLRNERAVDDRIQELREMKQPLIAKVRERDYEWLKRRNLISLSKDQMMKIYEQAKLEYAAQVKFEIWSDKKETRQAALAMIALIDKGEETQELKEKYQDTARRLAVVEWIKENVGDAELAV